MFKFQKVLFGEQVTESDDQTEQIPFSGKNKAARYVRIRSGTG